MRAVLLAIAGIVLAMPLADAHQGDARFDSTLRTATPAMAGLRVVVLNRGDRLQLTNRTKKDVAIPGYDGEPYARVLADGTVEVNERSPATYLNTDPLGDVQVPATASSKAAPRWKVVDKTGTFEWHDHRVHWMGGRRTVPTQVKDAAKRTKVYDWKVPVDVGGRRVTLAGTLVWVGDAGGGVPAGAVVLLVVLVVAGGVGAVVVRRGRRGDVEEAAEAW